MNNIAAILAVDKNLGLGYQNNILFKNVIDMKHFSTISKQYYYCAVGRKTAESLDFKLKDRELLVLSKNNFSKDQLLQNYSKFIVIGGNEIYTLFQDQITTWYITVFNDTATNVDVYLDKMLYSKILTYPSTVLYEDKELSIIKYIKGN